MTKKTFQKSDIVSFWTYAGTVTKNVGRIDYSNLYFAKVLSVGKVFATVVTEHGNKRRIRITELSHAPDGKEYFKD